MALRIGILGGSGIGLVHARIFNELGAEVIAVLCSSQQKSNDVAKKLALESGVHVAAYNSLDSFLLTDLDAVSICTPPFLHIQHIKACFERNIPVFCEKPLFWDDSMTLEKVEQELKLLEQHQNRRLFVNTSNSVFLDAILAKKGKPKLCVNFSFEFYTNGRYTNIGIARDLLPHGLSLLISLLGECPISNFNSFISNNIFCCSFSYGDCIVNFDFREDPNSPRHMRIALNESVYTRVQSGFGPNYKVALVDDLTGEVLLTEDPFRAYIRHFLDYVINSDSKSDDGFDIEALNLTLMAKCLHLVKNNL